MFMYPGKNDNFKQSPAKRLYLGCVNRPHSEGKSCKLEEKPFAESVYSQLPTNFEYKPSVFRPWV